MDPLIYLIILTVFLSVQKHVSTARTERRLLDFRKMAKVFVRYNIKVNVVPYSATFAFAMGFRANWDIKPQTFKHPKRRISNQAPFMQYNSNSLYLSQELQNNNLSYVYPNNEYSGINYPQIQPNNQYSLSPYSTNQYTFENYQNSQYSTNQYLSDQMKSGYQPQRAIHSAVQRAFDWHGLNGSACLQRTLCEVSVMHQDDIISHIFKLLFNGTEEFDCPEDIPCPVSLIQLVDHIITQPQTN